MHVLSVVSTKGGIGKTTTVTNLCGFLADTRLRVLLIDLDLQPTLSSYFTLVKRALGGTYVFTSRAEPNRGERYDAC